MINNVVYIYNIDAQASTVVHVGFFLKRAPFLKVHRTTILESFCLE